MSQRESLLLRYVSKRRPAMTTFMVLLGFILVIAGHTGLSVVAVGVGAGKSLCTDYFSLCGFRDGVLFTLVMSGPLYGRYAQGLAPRLALSII